MDASWRVQGGEGEGEGEEGGNRRRCQGEDVSQGGRDHTMGCYGGDGFVRGSGEDVVVVLSAGSSAGLGSGGGSRGA